MPSNATRRRIEWMPSDAAIEALQHAEELFGDLGRQATIDKLLITGLSALLFEHWRAPLLYGRNRDQWRLPANVRNAFPGDSSTHSRSKRLNSREVLRPEEASAKIDPKDSDV